MPWREISCSLIDESSCCFRHYLHLPSEVDVEFNKCVGFNWYICLIYTQFEILDVFYPSTSFLEAMILERYKAGKYDGSFLLQLPDFVLDVN